MLDGDTEGREQEERKARGWEEGKDRGQEAGESVDHDGEPQGSHCRGDKVNQSMSLTCAHETSMYK